MSHQHIFFKGSKGFAAELQELNAGYPPEIVVKWFIDVFPERYDVLKQDFGDLDLGEPTSSQL